MAIAQVGGTTNNSGSNVSTLSATYSPTAGNTLVLLLNTSAAITALTVQDSHGNNLTAGPVQGNLRMFYQFGVPATVTGYTASWTTAVQVSIAVEEYSGVGGVNTNFAANHTSATSASASIVTAIVAANNWIVAGFGEGANSFTTTVGTNRQNTTASSARVELQDNTSASIGNVTNTATLPSSAWTAVSIELGGAGTDVVDQDVVLVATQPTTSSKARVPQDVVLVATQSIPKARVNQDVVLVAVSRWRLRPFFTRIIPRQKKPHLKKRWGPFQNAALLAAQPYHPIIERGVRRPMVRQKKMHVRKHFGFQNAALLSTAAPVRRIQPFIFVST